MTRSWIIASLVACLTGLPPAVRAGEPVAASDVTAAANPSPPAPASPEGQLDEIIVQGSRLWHMRKAVIETDDLFFARYNAINPHHDFDVHCAAEAPLGTRLKERVCRAAFQQKAEQDWARMILLGIPAIPPEVVRLERADEYRQNLLDVARSDPQLMKLLRQRAVLESRYQAELAKRRKGGRVVAE